MLALVTEGYDGREALGILQPKLKAAQTRGHTETKIELGRKGASYLQSPLQFPRQPAGVETSVVFSVCSNSQAHMGEK